VGGSVGDHRRLTLVGVTRDEDEVWHLSEVGPSGAHRSDDKLSLARRTTQDRTQALASQAEARISELAGLRSTVRTSTATKAEIEKAAPFDEQLQGVLRDVMECKRRSAAQELEKRPPPAGRRSNSFEQ
jgi:hypothetical protein